MDNEIKDLVVSTAESIKSAIETGISFASQEIPEVLTQILWWHGIKSGLFFIVGALLLVLSFVVTRWVYKTLKEKVKSTFITNDLGNPDDGLLVTAIFILFSWSVGTILIFDLTWLNILVAPKLYLLEYAASLVK